MRCVQVQFVIFWVHFGLWCAIGLEIQPELDTITRSLWKEEECCFIQSRQVRFTALIQTLWYIMPPFFQSFTIWSTRETASFPFHACSLFPLLVVVRST